MNNDPQTGRVGFISKIDELDKRLTDLDQRDKILKTKAVTAGAVITILAGVLYKAMAFLITFLK